MRQISLYLKKVSIKHCNIICWY